MKKNHVFEHYAGNVWRKTFMVMKLSIFLFLLGIFSVSAEGFGQGGSISLKMEHVSLEDILQELKSHSDYTFVYSDQQVENVQVDIFEVKNANLKVVMDECLQGTDLEYYVESDVVVIRKKAPVIIQKEEQEKRKLKGTVTDDSGNILPGVSVVVKGTTTGVATNKDGNYTIEVDGNNVVLVFSFVGMLPQEVAYSGQANLNVILKADSKQINEVVVTGYQEVKRERITGAIETINADEIADRPFASVDQLLSGKVSGLASFMSSGQAGEAADIRIRGINTLSGRTQPLWIVDGLPLQGEVPDVSGGGFAVEANILNNGVGNIPVSDISSITVLKDAAAAAIYGARAANGVIIITTKSGHEGDIYCNFNGSFSFSKAPEQSVNLMNTDEKIEFEEGLFEDFNHDSRMTRSTGGRAFKILFDVKDGKISKEEGDRLINDLSKNNTNWFDEIFRNSISKSYGFNISGGNKKITYYLSANKLDKEGVLRNDNYDNTGIRAKGTFKPNEKFDITFGLSTTIRNKKYHHSWINPLKYATYANPYERAYDENGDFAFDNTYLRNVYKKGLNELTYGTFNILNEIDNTGFNSKYTSTSASANLRYYIIKELKLSSRFVKTNTQKNIKEFANPGTYTSYNKNWYKKMISRDLKEEENLGYYKESAVFSDEYSFNNTLEFSKEFENKIYTSVLVGQEISSIKTNDLFTYMPEYYPQYDISGYPDIADIDGENIDLNKFGNRGFNEKRYSSFFSSFTVGYDDRYILNFNARYDGADIIGSSERFTPLWSVSARWNLHKENFLKDNSIINELSLKGEYGYTGNINRDAYPFTVITLSGTDRYEGNLIAKEFTYPNPAIKWEKKEEKSFGISSSMFNYRFNYNFSYYHNYVSDVLGSRRMPVSAGVTSLIANVSNLLNTGYEISFNVVPVKFKDFQLSLNFNGAYNKNEISNAYHSGINDIKLQLLKDGLQPWVSGYSVGTVFGLIDKGVNPATGDKMVEVNRAQIELLSAPVGSVDYASEIIDRDDVNMSYDRVTSLGQLNPKYTGGFGITTSYKNWELNGHFTFEAGHIIPVFSERLSSPYGVTPTDYSKVNVLKDKLNRWRQPGDITNVRRFDILNFDTYGIPLDTDYEKGDYLKLKSIILGYRLPAEILKKANIGIKRLKFSVQADNLFTLTNYSGIDPETRNDFGYPIPTTYRFTLNIGL